MAKMRQFSPFVKWDSCPAMLVAFRGRISRAVKMEDNFGSALMATFIDAAYPMERNVELMLVSWPDVEALFFNLAPGIKAIADASPEPWRLSSVAVLDGALRDLAESGIWQGEVNFPAVSAQELWRRWRHVIVGAKLEAEKGEPLNLPLPRDAPEDLRGVAVMLYMLGGPGRAYPPNVYG
jgi:hypothetical protein